MSFRILLTARTCSLPTSWRARVLVLVLVCTSSSCSSARARALVLVLVLECSRTRACSCSVCRTIQTSQLFIFRLFAFCSVYCCKIIVGGNYSLTPSLALFAQLQALLGDSSNCSSSTSASTSSSASGYNASRAATHAHVSTSIRRDYPRWVSVLCVL